MKGEEKKVLRNRKFFLHREKTFRFRVDEEQIIFINLL